METLSLEGVRCFGERQELPIRPVTLLVGENSSGKSTVLAMVRAAWDLAFRRAEPDFNEEPFDLGGYDAIAHYHGGQGKRVHDFSIAASFVVHRARASASKTYEVTGTFQERAGQPLLSELRIDSRGVTLLLSAGEKQNHLLLRRGDEVLLEDKGTDLPRSAPLDMLAYRSLQTSPKDEGIRRLLLDMWDFRFVSSGGREPRPIASAPIRSKPIRTYNPKRETQEPAGSHVPMELATLHATSPAEFEQLAEQLAAYGKDANLFSKLHVKRLGKKAGDPFQLMVAVDRYPFNLRDVGYGVSQVFPILVDTLTAPRGQTFLLQQPEVHLHPRAQAALGSLLVDQAATRNQTFVVETHSDHLVDRVRMDVRDKRSKLRTKDIIILYFERLGGRAKVHPIEMDDDGNLVEVPPGYRQFFLEEERRLLGI